MKLSADMQAFCDRLGHSFVAPALLVQALTHSSVASANRDHNQRLEFLGDRVLGLVIAEALLEADTVATEGQIAPRYNALVRREACADVAREIDLGAVLRLGRSEMKSGGRRKEALLADAMEAVIAAVWLDGGHVAARAVVRKHWRHRIANVDADARDAKTALQEWAQGRGDPVPEYIEVGRSGPDHKPEFTIEARLSGGQSYQATAGSKRQAEQAAAAGLLEKLTS